MKTLLQLLLAQKLLSSNCVLFTNNLLPSDTVPLNQWKVTMHSKNYFKYLGRKKSKKSKLLPSIQITPVMSCTLEALDLHSPSPYNINNPGRINFKMFFLLLFINERI